MRRIALALALLVASLVAALAQQPLQVIGPITPGNIPQFNSSSIVKDSGVAGGAALFANPTGAVGLTVVNGAATTATRSDAAPPLSASVQSALTGTLNQLAIGTGGFGFSTIALGGDCTFTSPNITCTKVNGVSYGSSPATDTVPVVTAANTSTYTALPNCTSGLLQYSTATHLFSCGATGAGTVTNVATAGLASGGPITTTGTITVTAAAKSDQQTGTSNVLAVTPLHQQDHDSAEKAWVKFADNGVNGAQTINASYNVTSVSRTALGTLTITFTTPFVTADYVCNGNAIAGGTHVWTEFISPATTNIQIFFLTNATTAADPATGMVSCRGRQ
jgi:hypothetical protein